MLQSFISEKRLQNYNIFLKQQIFFLFFLIYLFLMMFFFEYFLFLCMIIILGFNLGYIFYDSFRNDKTPQNYYILQRFSNTFHFFTSIRYFYHIEFPCSFLREASQALFPALTLFQSLTHRCLTCQTMYQHVCFSDVHIHRSRIHTHLN